MAEEDVVGRGPDPGQVLEGDEGNVVDEHAEDTEAHLGADQETCFVLDLSIYSILIGKVIL